MTTLPSHPHHRATSRRESRVLSAPHHVAYMRRVLLCALFLTCAVANNGMATVITGSFGETLSITDPGPTYYVFFPGQNSLPNISGATRNFAVFTSPERGFPFNSPAVAKAGDFADISGWVRTEYAYHGSSTIVAGLPGGTTIDASLDWVFRVGGGTLWDGNGGGDWANGESKYMAFRIDPTETGTDYHYGWLQFAIASDGSSITVGDWAYSTVLNESTVTPIPEPSVLALWLGIMAVLSCVRKRGWPKGKEGKGGKGGKGTGYFSA